MKIKIISVGKSSDPALQQLTDEFQKRLSRWAEIEWQLIPHAKTIQAESSAILKQLSPDHFVVLLDETGQLLTTPEIATKMVTWIDSSKKIVFIIGGSFGVDAQLINRADFVWSLSRLVFPHQIVRLLLMEQLYRIFSLNSNGKYHH